MSDTPIAEQVAADLGMPWVIHGHMEGQLDNGWFTDSGPVGADPETGTAEPVKDAAPSGPVGAASADLYRKGPELPTEKELEQMRAAAVEAAKSGDADKTAKLLAVYDLVTGEVPGPEPKQN